LDLASQHENLSLELGLVALARCDRVEEDARERVEQSGDHSDTSYRLPATFPDRGSSLFSLNSTDFMYRTPPYQR
jgi:hypothetical protein